MPARQPSHQIEAIYKKSDKPVANLDSRRSSFDQQVVNSFAIDF